MIPKNDKVKTFTKLLVINYSDTLQRETNSHATFPVAKSSQIGGKRNFFQEINAGGIKQSGYHHFTSPNKKMDSDNNQQKRLKTLGKG